MNSILSVIYKKLLVLIIFSLLVSCNNSKQNEIKPIENSNTESLKTVPKLVIKEGYCYCLPDSLSQQRFPLLFILDPHAKGDVSISKYMSIANDLNIILVASLYSKNGMPFQEINSHVSVVFNQIRENNLPVDLNQIIFCGFSGGGRVATELSKKFDKVMGVVSCGAANPLEKKSGIRNVIICGKEDFNYPECVFLALDQAENSEFRFIPFDGKHEWPSVDDISHAIEFCLNRNIMLEKFTISEDERLYLASESKIRNELIQAYTSKNIDWWINKIEDYRYNENSSQILERQLSKRLLAFIGMLSYAYTKNAAETGNIAMLKHCIQIYEYIEPDNSDMLAFKKRLEVLLSEKR